jgi:hypothetical protein
LHTWTDRAGVDSHAVILVIHSSTSNVYASALRNIESIGIRSQAIFIAIRVVDRDIREGQIGRAVDAKHLHRRVQQVQPADRRGCQVMREEEGRLCCAAVGAFAVPPARAITVDDMSAGAGDGDVGA